MAKNKPQETTPVVQGFKIYKKQGPEGLRKFLEDQEENYERMKKEQEKHSKT